MTLLGQWLFTEASSGTGPTSVLDSSPGAAANLTPRYTTGAAWSSITAGNGLTMGSDFFTGCKSANLGTNKIQAGINGSKLLTWELVINYTAGGTFAQVCDINDNGTSAQIVGIYPSNGGGTTWEIWTDFADPSPSFTLAPPTGVTVVHVVFDSTQATAANRVKVYYNGVAQTLTSVGGVPLNRTLVVVSASNVQLGSPAPAAFGFTGTLYGASVWNEAFDAATAANRSANLLANNDSDPLAPLITRRQRTRDEQLPEQPLSRKPSVPLPSGAAVINWQPVAQRRATGESIPEERLTLRRLQVQTMLPVDEPMLGTWAPAEEDTRLEQRIPQRPAMFLGAGSVATGQPPLERASRMPEELQAEERIRVRTRFPESVDVPPVPRRGRLPVDDSFPEERVLARADVPITPTTQQVDSPILEQCRARVDDAFAWERIPQRASLPIVPASPVDSPALIQARARIDDLLPWERLPQRAVIPIAPPSQLDTPLPRQLRYRVDEQAPEERVSARPEVPITATTQQVDLPPLRRSFRAAEESPADAGRVRLGVQPPAVLPDNPPLRQALRRSELEPFDQGSRRYGLIPPPPAQVDNPPSPQLRRLPEELPEEQRVTSRRAPVPGSSVDLPPLRRVLRLPEELSPDMASRRVGALPPAPLPDNPPAPQSRRAAEEQPEEPRLSTRRAPVPGSSIDLPPLRPRFRAPEDAPPDMGRIRFGVQPPPPPPDNPPLRQYRLPDELYVEPRIPGRGAVPLPTGPITALPMPQGRRRAKASARARRARA